MDDHIVQVGSQKYIKDSKNIFHFIVLNSQIWLRQLMDDRQLGYIEKILFKNLIKFLGFTAASYLVRNSAIRARSRFC